MNDATDFRRQAERYRKLADAEQNPDVARRMREFASHHDALAEVIEEAERRDASVQGRAPQPSKPEDAQ